MSSQSDLPVREAVTEQSKNPTEALYDKMGSTKDIPELDVLLVGAGFASFTLMNKYALPKSCSVVLTAYQNAKARLKL